MDINHLIDSKQALKEKLLQNPARFRHNLTTHQYSKIFPSFRLAHYCHYLAKTAKCFWLLDIIASLQDLSEIRSLKMQCWRFLYNQDGGIATLICTHHYTCTSEAKKAVFTKDFYIKDFLIDELIIYVRKLDELGALEAGIIDFCIQN
jgi:hypothetical protein